MHLRTTHAMGARRHRPTSGSCLGQAVCAAAALWATVGIPSVADASGAATSIVTKTADATLGEGTLSQARLPICTLACSRLARSDGRVAASRRSRALLFTVLVRADGPNVHFSSHPLGHIASVMTDASTIFCNGGSAITLTLPAASAATQNSAAQTK